MTTILTLFIGTWLGISLCIAVVALVFWLERRRPRVHPRTVRPRVVYRGTNGHRSDVTIERVRR